MIYIIGSGFSGLTTAYALNKKGIKSTIISPGEKNKIKNISLIKYLLKNNGEILNNSNFLSKKINKLNKSNVINCKYLLSHMEGGQSNIWGGVVGNIGEYNYNNSLIKKSEILKYKKEIINLLKIIKIKYIKKKNKKINSYLFLFCKSSQHSRNLKLSPSVLYHLVCTACCLQKSPFEEIEGASQVRPERRQAILGSKASGSFPGSVNMGKQRSGDNGLCKDKITRPHSSREVFLPGSGVWGFDVQLVMSEPDPSRRRTDTMTMRHQRCSNHARSNGGTLTAQFDR